LRRRQYVYKYHTSERSASFRFKDLAAFVAARGLSAKWSDEIPGTTRCHIDDPFGNRIELIDED